MDIHEILARYWGYSSFREKQEDIITSVLEGKDTLALLPTGGGKSICFQIPALSMEGICIVVSPLIALMRDQVENLNKKKIPSLMLSSGMTYREIDIALDNAVYGNYKFLYVSPERLKTELFIERCKKMKVNLIAVDEAHCISQWGYDFRPPYLEIANLRQILPKVAVVALTATATKQVVEDIQEKLNFKKKNLIQKSFTRENLAYVVLKEEDVLGRMLKILDKIPGSSIVYASTRKRTVEIANLLRQNAVSADFYHAGVPHEERNRKQAYWLENRIRCMVATSAFGMGIDKPNVRSVIHVDPTDSLEAYFQEAGRAGRDGKKAYAVQLLSPKMPKELTKRVQQQFPSLKEMTRFYNAICNFFQIPLGGGMDQTLDFPIQEIADRYNFTKMEIFYACKLLEKAGLITFNEAFYSPSKLKIECSKEDLYRFQVAQAKYDNFIKTILRSYGGIYDEHVKIDEKELAQRVQLPVSNVRAILHRLHELEILDYIPQSNEAKLTFLVERVQKVSSYFTKEIYHVRKRNAETKLQAVLDYMRSEIRCRNQMLLSYFGEKASHRCGICDVCLKINKLELSELEFEEIEQKILTILADGKTSLSKITESVKGKSSDKVSKVLEFLLDAGSIKTDGIEFHL